MVVSFAATYMYCTLTTWHCPHLPAAAAAIYRYSPARRAHSSKPAAVGLPLWAGLLLWAHAGTDRRTDTVYRFIDPAGLLRIPCGQCQYVNATLEHTTRPTNLLVNDHSLTTDLCTVITWYVDLPKMVSAILLVEAPVRVT